MEEAQNRQTRGRGMVESREYSDNLKFVANHYGQDKTVGEIAEHTGLRGNQVYTLANALRKRGVNIPKLNRGDSVAWNNAINELRDERPDLF